VYAFPALGLIALLTWIASGEPSRPATTPVRGDRPGGIQEARATGGESGHVGAEAPGSGTSRDRPGVTGPGPGTGAAAEARSGAEHAGRTDSTGPDPATEEERLERDHLASGMAKLASDLEWSPGLREPPQQLVQPQPEPWRRDPSREGPSPTIEAIVPRRARAGGGDRVSIRGRNLRVVQVMFGATPARLLAARGNEVVVETPPGAVGPVTVAVTNDDGTWAIADVPFVYGD
jgi:hypothetical protein